MNVANKIDAWCNRATSLEKLLIDAATEFNTLAETNESMRDMAAPLNAAKAHIDKSFTVKCQS